MKITKTGIEGMIRAVTVVVALDALTTLCAHAEITIITESSSASAGGSGAFDVDLTNSGTSPVDISGFSFEVSVSPGSPVTFTGVDTNTTAPYIFGTYQSSPILFSSDSFPNTDFTASDADLTAPDYFVVVGAGQTVGLGDVSYTVAEGAPDGSVPVVLNIISGATAVGDQNGDNLTFTPDDGSITIGSISTVPEPSPTAPFAIAGLGLAGLILCARKRKGAGL